ncbi:hypothetical protein Hamer_G016466 [Homarus americanus]|uniref:Uncharacterized protein n=1 Tax=Homarus americanus TaxID=6706 RepID=A0A8J5N6I4_HOMAM|nr:hypothetical protein Hamer_G016466 [Homarus americanus]
MTRPPSTSPPHNHEVLSVCEFWKKYNIKNAVDRIVEAWHKINVATVLHAWKPLFANSEVSEWSRADRGKRGEAVCGGNANEHSGDGAAVPAPRFSDVQVEDLQEIVGQHQQQLKKCWRRMKNNQNHKQHKGMTLSLVNLQHAS